MPCKVNVPVLSIEQIVYQLLQQSKKKIVWY